MLLPVNVGLILIVKVRMTMVTFTDAVAEGKALEAELNKKGPGTCLFVSCDMTKDDDIKVLDL